MKPIHVMAICIGMCLSLCSCQFCLYEATLTETTRPAKAEIAIAQIGAQTGQEGTNTLKAIPIPPEVVIAVEKLVATWMDLMASVRKEVTIQRAYNRRWFACDSGSNAISKGQATHNDIGSVNISDVSKPQQVKTSDKIGDKKVVK